MNIEVNDTAKRILKVKQIKRKLKIKIYILVESNLFFID
jgi:hypothetical protein